MRIFLTITALIVIIGCLFLFYANIDQIAGKDVQPYFYVMAAVVCFCCIPGKRFFWILLGPLLVLALVLMATVTGLKAVIPAVFGGVSLLLSLLALWTKPGDGSGPPMTPGDPGRWIEFSWDD